MTDRAPSPWPADGSDPAASRRTVTLTDLARIPLHRARVVGALAACGLLAALGFLLLAPPKVTASAVVAVRPVVTDAFSLPGAGADRSVNMNVESGIATGTEVVQKLADSTGDDPRDVRNALEVEVPAGGQILRLTYQATSADAAVDTVNLAARSYIEVRRAMYETQRTDMLRSYDESIAKVSAQQAAIQKRVNGARPNDSTDGLLAELSGINNQLTQLNAARTEIASVDVNPGIVTQAAEQSLARTSGNPPLYLLAGLLGGGLLGVVLAFGWESVDRRVRSAADAQEASALPLLGTVRRRGFRTKPRAVDADIRYVSMAVAEHVRQGGRVVVLGTREDVSPITAGLAVALAADGRKVYVADDSGRAERLREAVLADRSRVPVSSAPARPAAAPPRQNAGTARPPSGPVDAPTVVQPAVDGPTVVNASVTTAAGNVVVGGAARRPSPHPIPGRTQVDPDATVTLPRITSDRPMTGAGTGPGRGGIPTGAVFATSGPAGSSPAATPDGGAAADLPEAGDRSPAVDDRSGSAEELVVGEGSVRVGPYRQAPEYGLVLVNAPPAEADERGVRVARNGAAVVVVERDRTRLSDLRRLVERLRAAGVAPLGFVLTRSGRD